MLGDGVSGRPRASGAAGESTDGKSTPNGVPRPFHPNPPGGDAVPQPEQPSEGAAPQPVDEPNRPSADTSPAAKRDLEADATADAAADPPADASGEPGPPPSMSKSDPDPARPPASDQASPPSNGDDGSAPTQASPGKGRRRKAKAAKQRRKAPWWELPALVLLAILIAIGVKTFVVQPFYIPSQSMEKTLHGCPGCHGDRILVNKPIYDLRDPHPGDIVVFHAPKGWDDEPVSRPPSNPLLRAVRGFGQLVGFVPPDGQVLVKRVIATGGQTVKGDSAGHVQVSATGSKGPFRTLTEPYVFVDKGQGHSMRAFGPVTVPKGRLWVMGDHRNDSADSRYHCGPGGTDSGNDSNCNLFAKEATVPVDDVIGKAFVIAWPPSRWRTLGTPSTFQGIAATAAPAIPTAAASAIVFPVYVVRRRRRRSGHPVRRAR
jgi:signal peptidase I